MIDSILLKIPYSKQLDRSIFMHEKTKSSNSKWFTKTIIPIGCASFKQSGIYLPHLWLEQRKYPKPSSKLCIQVSLPKLLYGTNFYNLDLKKLSTCLGKLIIALKGVFNLDITASDLLHAPLHRIDFTHQFLVPRRLGTAQDIIDFLYISGYRPRTEIERRDIAFGKGGYWLKFHNTSHAITFYDKVLELQKQGYTSEDKRVLQQLRNRNLLLQALRYEVSLFKPQIIRSIFPLLNAPKQKAYTLTDVVKYKISSKILSYYFKQTFENSLDLLYCNHRDDLRTYLRNKYGYTQQSFYYFLFEEIYLRGQKVVWNEITLLHGHKRKAILKQQFSKLAKSLAKQSDSNIKPLAWIKTELEKYKN
ncbi:MAG: hypothetical protein A2V81_04995 [Candidatus Abawacabacteria bacterium RBG_16_42_10]|uniref:Replication-associated protein G2P N-terminal domain-containing protein n=1 Tax=Candidatus Abawacabacteria bacterium RBG_16_42_10 TaxID=1817814 RepID=A0A1F4XIS8_9BACT|nr:MAG: hypothetical protein A2V81_04995 [Candidatus Abawacabacteria bacterium RBG_16_42_10]